jgi:hypothetical protein
MSRGAPVIELEVAVSLRHDLGAGATGPASTFVVREIERAEIAPLLGGSAALRRSPEALDAVTRSHWRCFVALDGDRPVHVSFVEMRPERPLLFGAVTEPSARGRGAFRVAVRFIAERLRASGETSLYSWTRTKNDASLRAHLAAGFVVIRRVPDLRVRGRSVRERTVTFLRSVRRAIARMRDGSR